MSNFVECFYSLNSNSLMNNFLKIAQIKSMSKGESFECCALLTSAQKKIAKNGSEFLVADFKDNSASTTIMLFIDSAFYLMISNASAGDIFKISGRVDFYNEKFSPRIENISKIDESEASNLMHLLTEVSPNSPDAMRKELDAIIEEISNAPLRETVKLALSYAGENFYTSTAATRMHHAYIHGLLEHSLSMAKTAKNILPFYPFVDKSLALAGCILHDIGKVEEYNQGLVFNKTRSGFLQGHTISGYKMVRKASIKSNLDEDTTERLEHIILSHHGELEWGAAALPATPEAVFVSCVDYFDSRMGAICLSLKEETKDEFSEFNPALKVRLLKTPPVSK